MDDRISTQITSSLIQYLEKSGAELKPFLDAVDFSREYLCSPQKLISNEDLIIIFSQAREILGQDHIAYWTGRTLVESRKQEFINQALIFPSKMIRSVQNLLEWADRLFPLGKIEFELISRREFQVRISKQTDYIHTRDHCQFFQGLWDGIIAVNSGMVEKNIEESCMLPIDQKGEIDGKLYRFDDQARLIEYETDSSGQPQNEKGLNKIDPHRPYEIKGVRYLAGSCAYRLSWRDGRSPVKRLWDQTFGSLLKFFRIVLLFEKSRVPDNRTFQQVAFEWRHLLRWEESYSLTKAKYLAYLGVIVLTALPLAGRFFEELKDYLSIGLSNVALSLLILILGMGITKLQLNYARKLHREKSQADQFLQRAGVGVTMINRDYEIVYANPLILDLYGEALGRKCHQVFRWETKPCPECALEKVFRDKSRTQMEVKNITRSGLEKWFYTTTTPILDQDERVVGMLMISNDIDEKKRLEFELSGKQAQLEASERKYRHFMEHAADAILITDLTGCLIEASQQFYQLLEIPDQAEAQDAKVLENAIYETAEKQKLDLLSRAMIQDGKPREFELKLQCRSGRWINVEVRAIPIIGEREMSWMQFILRDITQRKRREFEKNLMLSVSNAIKDAPSLQELLDQALEGIGAIMEVPIAAIFIKDPDQPQLKLAAQIGRSPEAMKRLARIAIDGSANNIASRAAILNRPIVVSDVRQLKMDHDTRQRVDMMGVSSMICMPMLTEEQLLGVIQIATKDTQFFDKNKINILSQMANELAVGIARQRLRDALEEKNRELVKKHRELENATLQLLQNEKLASIGQLAAGIAHEINNPMGFINANLNILDDYRQDLEKIFAAYDRLLSRTPSADAKSAAADESAELNSLKQRIDASALFEEFKAVIRESKEGAERVKRIIQNLKEFSHPTKGEPELTDINQNIESTLSIVWNELKYKAEVKKEYGELPQVNCYPQELSQVFMNILINAAQAIKERGEINIKTWAENGEVCVRISDTGCGIKPEQLPKIFDPFFTTKEVGKGTGLGLSISYGIVKKHRGEIKAESELGKGSAFTVSLPVDALGMRNEPAKQEAGGIKANEEKIEKTI